jgi:hypothetical protein
MKIVDFDFEKATSANDTVLVHVFKSGAKGVGRVAQTIEHLPSKSEALSSNPSATTHIQKSPKWVKGMKNKIL